ncbi:MAG: VOC family protein [Cyanobacteria bacterium P01_A01_bin.17]
MRRNTLITALSGFTVAAAIAYGLPALTEGVAQQADVADPLSEIRAEHIMIATPDYSGTIDWYREKLGFRIKHEWTVPEFPDLQLAYLEKNGFIVEVVASPDTPKVTMPEDFMARLQQPGIGHFAFLVEDVDTVTSVLEAKGVKVVVPPTSFPDSGRRLSFIEDNNGYMIEFLKELPLSERQSYTGDSRQSFKRDSDGYLAAIL